MSGGPQARQTPRDRGGRTDLRRKASRRNDMFEAAENLPIPEMNRAGAPQAQLRTLYE
jgi:hypothetical protein